MNGDELLREYVETNPGIRSKNTERLLSVVLRHFAAHLTRAVDAADFTDRNITAYMRYRRGVGRAETTIEFETAKLRAIQNYASARGYVPPTQIKLRRQRPQTPKALLRCQIRALFAAAQNCKRPVGGVAGGLLFPALLALIWESAERIGAVHSLERSDIDLVRREVTFRTRKGGGRILRKEITRSTACAIRHLLAANPAERPFAPVGVTTLYHHLDRIMAEAGIPKEKRQKFHALRRSHASYLKAAGGDPRESLDHSSELVTIRHYIDPRVANAVSPSKLLFSPFGFWHRLKSWAGLW